MDYFELAKEICYPNRFEIKDVERLIEFDEVDSLKLVEQDGVLCLIDMADYPEQEEHESGVNWNSRNEDEDR